jgi:predicted phage terminase large subunit-like protein
VANDTEDLRELLSTLTIDQVAALVADMSPLAAASLLESLSGVAGPDAPPTPLDQALALDEGFRVRPHLAYLSDRLVAAVNDVEEGRSRRLIVEMPPRSGKTTLATLVAPAWMLRRHPNWPIAITSHDGQLATTWGRQIRRWVEGGRLDPVSVARDAGAASSWETIQGGKVLAISIRESFTGRGAKVLVIDDPHKDFIDAHSAILRQSLWDWWLSVAQTRLEPPYLIVVVMTRWHEDDFVGRLLSEEHEGDPGEWERIRLPALSAASSSEPDLLDREPGEPLLSPLLDETNEQALSRWADIRANVGTYTFSAMYQQRPAPAKGVIFDTGWWQYWTTDPSKVTEDGRVVHIDPMRDLSGGRWLDSWDASFKGTDSSDWVVGQRWCRLGPDRFLIAQRRGRWSFTQTIAAMRVWSNQLDPMHSPCGHLVHQRLIEDKANGPAIIDTLRRELSGLKAINPKTSKEARARSITPEVESGHVYLPHPTDPGNEWVTDLLSELRNFPHDAADDQVDALTQALTELREGSGSITVPGRLALVAGGGGESGRAAVSASLSGPGRMAALARTDMARPRPGMSRRGGLPPRPTPRLPRTPDTS